MRFQISSFLAGILLGVFLLLGTLTVLGQNEASGITQSSIIEVVEEISTTVQLDGKMIPAIMTMNLKILLDDKSLAVNSRERDAVNDDGSKNLIRNVDLPADGGLAIFSPRISFDEADETFIFGTEIGMWINIHSFNAKSKVAGEGIQQVTFTITDLETEEDVYTHTESSSLYCLFAGDTAEECAPKTFAELGNRWPFTNKWIYNGDYNMNIDIETEDDSGDWNFPIRIQGGLERPNKTNSYNNSGG